MLLTTCPNCAAQFKVQTEQLNIRQGRVMCGRCRQVFDAFQSLTRGPDTTGPHLPLAPAETQPERISSATAEVEPSAIFLEDIDSTENGQAEQVTPPLESGAAPSTPSAVPVADNPLLNAAGPRQSAPPPRTLAWSLACGLLGLVAATQALYAFRTEVAHLVPEARPWLAKACASLGCDLPFGRDESVVKIEASDLVEMPGKAARIQVTATVVNRGRVAQDYPMLELRLTDNANQVVLSRALRPAEYLGREPARDEGIPPGTEVYVNLFAELAGKPLASGYAVRAYYP